MIRLAPLLPVLLAASCAMAPDRAARDRALTGLEIAVGQGRHAEAEALALALLRDEGLPPADRCTSLLGLGRALDGQGRSAEALDALAWLGRDCASRPESARGLVQVASLAARLGRADVAGRAWSRVITAFPDDPSALRAVDELCAPGGPDASPGTVVARLQGLYAEVPDREVSPYLLVRAARLAEAPGSSNPAAADQAFALYRRIVQAHPGSLQANDALLALARLALAAGRPAEAAGYAESLLVQREWSYLMVSYDTDVYPAAAFLRAEAARAAGEPPASVAGWYDAFARWFPESPRVPLARLRAARAIEASGDLPDARARFRRLAGDHPGTPAARWADDHLAGRDPGPEPAP